MLEGKVKINENAMAGQTITYHDSCYLGRANNIYEAPRAVLENLKADLKEMKKCRTTGRCCGAGGSQMFKEEEHGVARVNGVRAEQALETGATVVAAACPFCMTMMSDGIKSHEKENTVQVLDIAEIVDKAMA
jgi:Fe-S oxidoreductase